MSKKFVPPTVDDVFSYCLYRKNGIDAQAFVAFYASKGWKVGNQPMKDWKQAIITWERRNAAIVKPIIETSYSLDVFELISVGGNLR